MARIRSIKPEFWTSEQVMELSRDARLLFIGLWNFSDDAGIHPAKVRTLKAEVFPSDDLTSADVRRMVDELLAEQLVIEYEVEGETYWQVTGWHHQKIDQPTYKYPIADGTVPAGAAKRRSEKSKESRSAPKIPANTSGTFGEHSANTNGTFGECSPPESSRVESNGEERSKPCSSVAGTPTAVARDPERPAALLDPIPDLPEPTPTRRGTVCRLLRQAGVSDAAPHYLTDENWEQILAKRSDEEIVEFAKAKLQARAGQRTGLKYLAPGLLEDPEPIRINGNNPGSTGPPWWSSNERMTAKGRELGLSPRPGESWPDFKGRIETRLAAQGAVA